jgi:hypothetical protein
MDTDGIIRDAIASRICLETMIDSLNADIMNISDEHNSLQHVLGVYETFLGILQKELEKQNVEEVQIGEAFDVTGQVGYTLEMTPNDFFICYAGQKEKCTLQDVLEIMYEPKHVIGCVVGAIVKQHNRLLIDELKSGVKYVNDLVNCNKESDPEEGDIENNNNHLKTFNSREYNDDS